MLTRALYVVSTQATGLKSGVCLSQKPAAAAHLFGLLQVVLDFGRREHVELLVFLDDADLNVVLVHLQTSKASVPKPRRPHHEHREPYLALEAFTEREQRRVDGIFDLQIVVVALGKETHTVQ